MLIDKHKHENVSKPFILVLAFNNYPTSLNLLNLKLGNIQNLGKDYIISFLN